MSAANRPQRESIATTMKEATSDNAIGVDEGVAFAGFSRVPSVVPLPHKPLVGKPEFEFREHGYIGDAITLTLSDGTKTPAGDYPFTLQNGLKLTYGEINALAGDFYGTKDPISDGSTAVEQQQRFQDAYYWLAIDTTRQPTECNQLLGLLKPEVDAVNLAVQLHKDPSIVYSGILPDITSSLELATVTRTKIPGYLGLAQINWDHFGADARTAYNAGHAVALQLAVKGQLDYAYTMNAFADHYLEDSFSAGHMRTPRRMLHTFDGTGDICAKYMHDEDNAIGLSVQNPAGQTWTAYGDKRALDSVNADNLQRCLRAVQASANEIYTAYQTKTLPKTYSAWNEAPTLESALQPQTLAALFVLPNLCRSDLQDRRTEKYTSTWSYRTTALRLWANTWWHYPISLNGPQDIVPWTGITACNAGKYLDTMVFYTNPDDGIHASQVVSPPFGGYAWSGGPTYESMGAGFLFGPMASMCWQSTDGTLEAILVYLDESCTLSDVHYLAGKWTPGTLNSLNVKMDWYQNMSGMSWYDAPSTTMHGQIYFQETGQLTIKELCWNSKSQEWTGGAVLEDAMKGSSIAAIAVPDATGQKLATCYVFYQTADAIIRSYCWTPQKSWYQDTTVQWSDAAPATGIAVALPASSTAVNVFYTGSTTGAPLCQRTFTPSAWTLNEQMLPVSRLNNILAAVATDAASGCSFRVYCQDYSGGVIELGQASSGTTWTSTVVASSNLKD